MKMYILVREFHFLGNILLACAHGSLSCYLSFANDPDMIKWASTSFKKVICRVTDEEFENAKKFDKYVMITESSLNNREMALVFCPRKEWPEEFKKYKLYDYFFPRKE